MQGGPFFSSPNLHPKICESHVVVVSGFCARKYSAVTVVCSAAPVQQQGENCSMFAYTGNHADLTQAVSGNELPQTPTLRHIQALSCCHPHTPAVTTVGKSLTRKQTWLGDAVRASISGHLLVAKHKTWSCTSTERT